MKYCIICTTGPPSIDNIVNEACATSLSISWDTHNKMCGVISQLVTISLSSGARTFDATEKNNFTFTNLSSNTSYDVIITLRHNRGQLTTRRATIKTSPIHRMFSITLHLEGVSEVSRT